ncbi:hypothetical protein NBRC10512_000104 [Rhodotorula toruloides]|uniref:RHTO0S09e06150g1_1 n=2 Tax=Rhodotorula toruloides TaxID=5286 RepID=A0A061B3S5_RHOTO|nr:RanBP1 domain containing protein [Rhodotorula toruloides NP11]EMS19937.1 RanBP1 domain containing protein [Rhodotorula toruloides NP11]KAJ8292836.1 E3 SUMO-protein ligase RanBP2 [Rhodotorula toruloides]CDR44554.1 RHTO0S09e06150g1_1 [Rhodotorula toruloides]
MAKRGAEKQLTQDNVDDDERQEEGGSGDFRKASDQALSGRKIRGLPKRRGGGAPGAAPAAAPTGDVPKPSPFGGVASPNPFAALSASSSTPGAPNPFAFGSSAAQPASNGAAPSFSFGSTTSTFSAPASSSSTPSFGAPATSSFTFGAQAKPAAPAPAPAPAQSDKLKYYTSLRALNVSLLEALSSRIDKDPFIDLSAEGTFDKLEQKYEEHRARVDKEHGIAKEDKMAVEAPASSSAAAAPAPAPAFEIPEIFRNPPKPVPIADLTDTSGAPDAAPASTSSSAPQKATVAADDIPDIFKNPPKPVPIADLSEEPAENKIAPPAPPAVFAFAGSAVKSTSSSSSNSAPPAGGFVFKPDSAPKVEKSSFTFPAASSSSSAPSTSAPSSSAPAKSSSRDELKPPSAPKLAPAKLTNPPSKPSPLRFGESVSPPTTPEKGATGGEEAQKPKGGFSFGAQFGKIAKGEKEGEAKKDEGEKQESVKEQEEKKEPPKPAFSFGSSGSPFSFGSATSTSTAPASTAFSFGSAATSSSSTETPSKPALTFGGPTPFSTPASTSLFSAKPASSPPIATSFGSSSPPSFGFGAALQTKDKDQPAPFTAGRNTGFAFGSNIGSGGSTGSTGFAFGSGAPASDNKGQAAKTTTGFSFATAPPVSTSTDSTSAPAAASSTPFSFTASSAPPAVSSAPSTAGETDSRAQTPGANPFTAPGEGEEGEDVLHSVRGKVWRIEGGQSSELGIANVAVKERKEGGKVRLLARNETNGAVLINFSLYPSLSLKKEKVFVTFLGFGPDAKPVTYRLRFKDVAMVEEFVDAVEEAKKKLPAA